MLNLALDANQMTTYQHDSTAVVKNSIVGAVLLCNVASMWLLVGRLNDCLFGECDSRSRLMLASYRLTADPELASCH